MALQSIRENLARVEARIESAARRGGRRPDEVTIVAVSKTHPAEVIREAYEAGLRHFGENRVQEWEQKRAGLAEFDAVWHLVGHLQSNKAGRATGLFHAIDSLDDFSLAERLERARAELGRRERLRVLVEVRLAEEETKSGAETDEIPGLAEKLLTLPHLEFAGLMCIPPLMENPEQVRPYFRRLRELRDRLCEQLGRALPVLSMGMSADFEVAIEEGATEIRIGTAIFGTRTTK
jgi:PLP dependent protein